MPAEQTPSIWSHLPAYLFPGAAERDAGFRREILRWSGIALLVIGGVQIGVAVSLLFANGWLVRCAALTALGAATIACSRFSRLANLWRRIGLLSSLAGGAILITFAAGRFVDGWVALVMLTAVAILPVRPVQVAALGLSLGGVEALCGRDGYELAFVALLTAVSATLAALAYSQRRAVFNLRETEAQLLASGNAVSIATLTQTLSYELAQPVARLLSAVDSLLVLASRQASSNCAEQDRLALLQSDLGTSIRKAAGDVSWLASRMQRFRNVSGSAMQPVNVNQLLADAASIVEAQLPPSLKLKLDLGSVEAVECRPLEISSVIGNLIGYAVSAMEGRVGVIILSARQKPGEVEIEVHDEGPGLGKAQLNELFEPTFRTKGGRVRTGQWRLICSREIVRQQGGDLIVESAGEGRGSTVRVSLKNHPPPAITSA